MKKDIKLTPAQRALVETHLFIVRWTIYHHIKVNETIFGFSYEDLFQEGCIWLCRAATSYDPTQREFSTYARAVVRNGLLDYCRRMCGKQKRQSPLEVGERGELLADGQRLSGVADDFDARVSYLEITSLLEHTKKEYQGIARLGIEALELKIKGFSITDIARFYGVKPSHVGAWISRAAEKLRENESFLSELGRNR